MMNKNTTFICINLNDFHKNQRGPKTTAEMVFIDSKDENECKYMLAQLYPNQAFSVIRANYINKHIKYAEI